MCLTRKERQFVEAKGKHEINKMHLNYYVKLKLQAGNGYFSDYFIFVPLLKYICVKVKHCKHFQFQDKTYVPF